MKRLIIMQGHSGSGKSTFVKAFKKKNDIVLSTDDYFIDDEGHYKFDESKLQEYHMKTFQACINAMQNATRNNERDCTIWLDNTNCRIDDVKPYLPFAKFNKFEVVYIRMNGEFKSKAPVEVVEQQKKDLRGFKYE
jgi:predicted kinase